MRQLSSSESQNNYHAGLMVRTSMAQLIALDSPLGIESLPPTATARMRETRGNAHSCPMFVHETLEEATMGRGILLWLLGVPIPIILLLALFWH